MSFLGEVSGLAHSSVYQPIHCAMWIHFTQIQDTGLPGTSGVSGPLFLWRTLEKAGEGS